MKDKFAGFSMNVQGFKSRRLPLPLPHYSPTLKKKEAGRSSQRRESADVCACVVEECEEINSEQTRKLIAA